MSIRIFISHSSADKSVIEELQKMLQLACNLNQEDFFCTSISGLGCTGGEFFNEEIRNSLQEASVVIAYLSKNYRVSEFCCAELGATWISRESKCFFPLMDPDLDYEYFGGVLKGTHICKINDKDDLLGLVDVIVKKYASNSKLPYLSNQIDDFIRKYPALKSLVTEPFVCTKEQYDSLLSKYDSLKRTNDGLVQLLKEKDDAIDRLKKLKDHEEVKSFERELNEDSLAAFRDLAKNVSLSAKDLCSFVTKFIIYDFFGLTIRDYDDMYLELEKARDAGLLTEPFEGDFRVNDDNRHVKKVNAALKQFKLFVESLDEQTIQQIEDEYDADLDLHSTEFIDKVLC